jgi:glucuronoarabinoxylan endo-1,4-beta-xylanase
MGTKPPGMAMSGDVTVDPTKTYQTMDGFGEADVWQSKASSTTAQQTLLFDPVNGIGLTILRIGIEGVTGKIMGDAAFVDGPAISKFGGKVWAAPWSPPAADKDNNNVNNGGHLLTSSYDSWASTLAAFPAYYKQQSGVDLYAISAQNEPDFVASYESCIYSSAQMNAFIKVLGPKLEALNPPVHVLAAEPDVWSNLWGGDNYGNGIVNDATVSSLVTIIATHDYGNFQATTRPSPPASNTHHVWETECTYSAGASITAGLDVANGINAAVTSGGASGWVYWWTPSLFDGGSATNPPKRVYVLGNYSKYVRPGYVRVDVKGAPSSLQMVAFENPPDGKVVIVATNKGTSAQQASFFVGGTAWPASVTPYVTSATANLAAGRAITLSGGRFSASLDPQSVTTFVGSP